MHKQRLLIPHNMRSLIQPVLRSAIRELHIEVPEKVRDDQAHFVVGEAKESTSQYQSSPVTKIVMVNLLHANAVPRTSRERLKDSLLIVRESCVVAFDAWCEPAFGEVIVAIDEVVGRTVSGKMGDADADLGWLC